MQLGHEEPEAANNVSQYSTEAFEQEFDTNEAEAHEQSPGEIEGSSSDYDTQSDPIGQQAASATTQAVQGQLSDAPTAT